MQEGIAQAQVVSQPSSFKVNGSKVPVTASPLSYLVVDAQGSPVWTATVGGGGGWTGGPFAVNGSNVPQTASPWSFLGVNAIGSPTWIPTVSPAATGYNGATPYPTPATPTPFAVNGSAIAGTANAGSYLYIGAGGTPSFAATPATPYPTPTGWSVNGSVVPVTAVAGLGLVIGPGGTPTWTATPSAAATGYNGATPYPTPTGWAVNGSIVPVTAAAGLGLVIGPGGTPTWTATPGAGSGYTINGSAAPASASVGAYLGIAAGGTPTFGDPFSVNGSSVPHTAPVNFGLAAGPGGTPTWASCQPLGNGGSTASPYFFAPTAISALPTCTLGGSQLGAKGFVDNSNCNLAWGVTVVATTAVDAKCRFPVWCGAGPTSTTGGTPIIGWRLGQYEPRELSYPWNRPYYSGSPIASPGVLARWFD